MSTSKLNNLNSFSDRLRWARKELGMTGEEFGFPLGKDKTQISRLEGQGKAPKSGALLVAIEAIHGISRTWLETGKGKWKAGKKPDQGGQAETAGGAERSRSPHIRELAQRIVEELPIGLGKAQSSELEAILKVESILEEVEGSQLLDKDEIAQHVLKRLREEFQPSGVNDTDPPSGKGEGALGEEAAVLLAKWASLGVEQRKEIGELLDRMLSEKKEGES